MIFISLLSIISVFFGQTMEYFKLVDHMRPEEKLKMCTPLRYGDHHDRSCGAAAIIKVQSISYVCFRIKYLFLNSLPDLINLLIVDLLNSVANSIWFKNVLIRLFTRSYKPNNVLL